jgi:hypothetical protein
VQDVVDHPAIAGPLEAGLSGHLLAGSVADGYAAPIPLLGERVTGGGLPSDSQTMTQACRRLSVRPHYILPLAFLVVGLFLGVINFTAGRHSDPAGGRAVPAVDLYIGWSFVGYVPIESRESAAWWANHSRSVHVTGYVIATLSVLWIVRTKRNANRRAQMNSELEIIREYYSD